MFGVPEGGFRYSDAESDVVVVDSYAGYIRLVVGFWRSSFAASEKKVKCFMGGVWEGSGVGSSLSASFPKANRIFRSSLILVGMGLINFYHHRISL